MRSQVLYPFTEECDFGVKLVCCRPYLSITEVCSRPLDCGQLMHELAVLSESWITCVAYCKLLVCGLLNYDKFDKTYS